MTVFCTVVELSYINIFLNKQAALEVNLKSNWSNFKILHVHLTDFTLATSEGILYNNVYKDCMYRIEWMISKYDNTNDRTIKTYYVGLHISISWIIKIASLPIWVTDLFSFYSHLWSRRWNRVRDLNTKGNQIKNNFDRP